ncbi:MAG: agarase [Bacteroidetes bacterium]|nr:MAG: agarase [Bacteroidota bacterium]
MNNKIDRRRFIGTSMILGAGSMVLPNACSAGASNKDEGYYTVAQKNGRWWLVDPAGNHTFSIGLNHIDPAAIRYLASNGIWEEKYDNSMEKWLPKVKEDLRDWGFNCLGWEQEVVIITPEMHRHSRSFTFEEYQWLDMPYFHLLPVIESHQWEWETKLPDVTGKAFEEWCDYIARDKCARLKDDPKLIGYFFTDCPAWIHSNKNNDWKAPMLDPELEKTESGRKEIFRVASIYYKTIVDAIKRYDPNHLICGDRYEANAPISKEVLRAAMPYVDIFSFQCFGSVENIAKKMAYWGNYLKKPVLLADSMISAVENHGWPPKQDLLQDDIQYGEVMKELRKIPECMGFHLCGAYIKNNARRYGLLDIHENLEETTEGIKKVNIEQSEWVRVSGQ